MLTTIPQKNEFLALPDRGISREVAEKFGVTFCPNEADPRNHIYPYTDPSGIHIANKIRRKQGGPLRFTSEGDIKHAAMFGQQIFPPNPKLSITITEGECDAMAIFQMMGDWPVVSVKNGAAGAVKDVVDNFEYLNSFKEIKIAFDKDEAKVRPDGTTHFPGQEAAEKVARLFPMGKVRVLTFKKHKDANEYLLAGDMKAFQREWWDAPVYTPTGLKVARDMWDEISERKQHETIPYPWLGLNHKTYGVRLSELVIVTAETGVGKTSILKEFEHFALQQEAQGDGDPPKLGLMHLEEPNADTALGLMSITADKPLHLPDVRDAVSNEELREYFEKTLDNDRVVIWDHFGSNSIEEVLTKVRHMSNMGCKYIVIDHLSIIVSDQNGDERKQLDEISTKLKTLCMELNIAVIAVIHLNRQGLIRGTAGVEQLANIVVRLWRDKTDVDEWRRNVTKITIEKNRFCGRTGPACHLHYNSTTGRLVELTEEEVRLFESGQTQTEESWG